MFGAIGTYAATFSRVLAPHADVLACVTRHPIEGVLGTWLRHRIANYDEPGFACPIWSVGAYDEEPPYRRLQKLDLDLIIVVGFPRKLPAALINAAARLGAVNLHPALLPNDRGPCPLFWAFRRGDPHVGVTLHQLSDVVDAGDVLHTARIETPFGVTGVQLFERLGALGGELVVRNLTALLTAPWHLVPQAKETNAWAFKPRKDDLRVQAHEWTAARLFHFVRGVRTFGVPWAELADDHYYFADATAFEPDRNIPGEFVVIGDNLILKVTDGTVTLRLVRL